MIKSLLNISILSVLLTSAQAQADESKLPAAAREGSTAQQFSVVASGGFPGTFGNCELETDLLARAIEDAQAEALKRASEGCYNVKKLATRVIRAELKACRSWTPYYEATVELIYTCRD